MKDVYKRQLIAFMKYQNIETLNREILIELVDHIKVYENGNISVKFKFADELRRIAEYIEINTTQDVYKRQLYIMGQRPGQDGKMKQRLFEQKNEITIPAADLEQANLMGR